MFCPSKVMLPVLERSSPEMVCKVVVLPAPLAPMRVTIFPSGTSKVMPFTASMLDRTFTREQFCALTDD